MIQVNDIVMHQNSSHYPFYGIVRDVHSQYVPQNFGDGTVQMLYVFASVAYKYPSGGGMTLNTDARFFNVLGNIEELVTLADPEKD